MAGYQPPNGTGIPFKFTDAGYVKPTYNPTEADFHPEYRTSDLKAAIQVMGIYQESTYTYKKSCPTYVVGYSNYGVQILKGPCVYGGIRDLGAFIEVKQKAQGSADLSAYLKQLLASEVPVDLPAFIKSYEHLNLPARIHGYEVRNISAIIDTHLPSNILAYLKVFQREPKDLPASVYGWQVADLRALLEGLVPKDLPANVYGIPPKDLPAYLKVWPEDYLYATVHGWGILDLAAYIKGKPYSDLGGYIGAHPWINLPARLKGWVREAHLDLPAYIRAFQYKYLPAYIFAYEIKDLPATIIPIPYVPLYAKIHGWQEAYLGATLNGQDYPYQIKAFINATGGFKDLGAYAHPVIAAKEYRDLPGTLSGWQLYNLKATIVTDYHAQLSASVYPDGFGNLTASIFPKMIRLTTLLKVITLNHTDLSAMINVSCIFSNFANLTASLKTVFKAELGGYITAIHTPEQFDLGASIGHTLVADTLDKISLRIKIESADATTYDIIPVYFNLFSGVSDLPAEIQCVPYNTDLNAEIYAVYLRQYSFKYQKLREKIYKPVDYDKRLELTKVVEFSLKDAVKEYIYLSTASKAYAAGFFDKWIIQAAAFNPENRLTGKKRKLFRAANLYDLKHYKNIDEAVRDIIEFVSWEPTADLTATINLIHNSMSVNLRSVIHPVYITSTSELLSASVNGTTATEIVVGYDDGVELIK